MDYEHLIVEPRGDALWVTMNRPERLNALNRRLVEELRDFFVGLYWRHEVRVVVLTGAGGAFCAGLDLKERSNAGGRGVGAGLTGQRQISEIVLRELPSLKPGDHVLIDGFGAGTYYDVLAVELGG